MEAVFKKFQLAGKFEKKDVRKMDSIFRDLKRTPLRIENAYVKNKDSIFLVGDVTIYVPSQKDFYIPGDYFFTRKIKKGEITNIDFRLVILTNYRFEIKDTFFINPFDSLLKTKFITPDGFYPSDGLFYFSCYNFNAQTDSTYKVFYEKNKNTKILMSFLFNKNKILGFNQIHAPVNKQSFEVFFGYEDFRIWGTNKGSVYISNSIFPEIYHKNHDTSFLKVVYDNNLEKEYKLYEMHRDYNRNFDDYIPFSVIDKNIIHNGKFLLILYFYHSRIYINCYLPNMQLIQTVDITGYLNGDLLNKLMEYEVLTYITDKRIVFAYVDKQGKYVFLDLDYEIRNFNEKYFETNDELFMR